MPRFFNPVAFVQFIEKSDNSGLLQFTYGRNVIYNLSTGSNPLVHFLNLVYDN